MKINLFRLGHLHNDEHYTFMRDVKSLIEKYNASTLSIEELFNAFALLVANEFTANKKRSKSLDANNLINADVNRDNIFRGFRDSVISATNHFNPVMKQAGDRLLITFDSYGNISNSKNHDETAQILGLINKLNTDHVTDIQTLGISAWITELQAANDAYSALVGVRASESLSESDLLMREERVKTDLGYNAILKRLDALMEINGDAAYINFVKELNDRVDREINSLAIRRAKGKTPPPVV
ncbi:MAG: hypothetical protein HOO86_11685 [Bacteroidales bacterium]|nr:hypothetical protein [Bacteroidales bacterium]